MITVEGPNGVIIDFPEGTTSEVIASVMNGRSKPAPDTMTDAAKSLASGVGKGTAGLLGLVGDADKLVGAGADWLASKVMSPEQYHRGKEMLAEFEKSRSLTPPTSASIRQGIESVTGKFHEPETKVGRYFEATGEMLPATMAGPGSVVRKVLQAAGAGVGSQAAGDATKDMEVFGYKVEPYARVAGAVAGASLPDVARRVVTPNPISAERQRLLNTLDQEGVTSLTAGQRTGNKTLQYAESILGDAPGTGQRASRVQQEGQRQFTEAAMRRAGAGPNATPEVLAQNHARLGREFEDLSSRNVLQFDQQFGRDLNNAIRDYARVPQSQQRAIVENYVGDIVQHATTAGIMPGTLYQEMRSRLTRQAQGLRNSDPTLAGALRDIRNALDNNMRRSISPDDAQAWDAARREWGAQKTLEKAASRAGEATAEGQIVPSNLRNAVTAQNHGAYARGQGDFADLARAGSGVMPPLPNSGTGQRAAIHSGATLLGAGVGSALTGNPMLGIPAAAVAGVAGPAVAGRALMSRPAQAYLGNQLIGAPTRQIQESVRLTRLAQALLAAREQVPALGY